MKATTMVTAALLALLLTGCDRPVEPDQQARVFWAAVNQGDTDSAMALAVPGDAERQRRQLQRLRSADATITATPEVPAEAAALLLQTQLMREGPEGRYDIATVTVLRRVGDQWLVDIDSTAAGVREAALAAMTERLAAATRRLRDAAGVSAAELQRSMSDLVGELRLDIDQRTDALAEELATELADSVQQVGDELIDTLRALEQELQADPPDASDERPDEDRQQP